MKKIKGYNSQILEPLPREGFDAEKQKRRYELSKTAIEKAVTELDIPVKFIPNILDEYLKTQNFKMSTYPDKWDKARHFVYKNITHFKIFLTIWKQNNE